MPEIVLFHHAQGLTDGVREFAEELRESGHVLHTPDLYEGQTFAKITDGVAHVQELGFPTILERGRQAVSGLPERVLYAGMSLGVMPAELLTLTRPGAIGAVFLHGCVAPFELGSPWPAGVPLQVHMAEGDQWLLPPNSDLEDARRLTAELDDGELFLYAGERHLFADNSLSEYDHDSAELLKSRVLPFLERLG